MLRWILFLVVVFGNSWIWRIFGEDVWLGLAVAMGSMALMRSTKTIEKVGTHPQGFMLILLFMVLFWQQWVHTNRTVLTEMPVEERIVRQERVGYYPAILRRVGAWWELRPEMMVLRNMERNFWQAVDLNYYFFANHPREVVGVQILNKFWFVLLPLFLLGLVRFIKEKRIIFFVFGLGLPVFWLSLIGHDSKLGPFVMFPGIIVLTGAGFELLLRKLFIKGESDLL